MTSIVIPPHGDPLLWIADALARCSSPGARRPALPWQERIDALAISQDVGRP